MKRPGVYEASMHTTLRELIYGEQYAQGMPDGRKFKAIIPGGSSVPLLLDEHLDTPASFDSIQKAGSLLGSAGLIVLDDTVCMVWLAMNLLHFYRHESCGKCTPCREGGDWLYKLLQRRRARRGADEGHRSAVRRRQQHRRQDAVRVRRRGGDAGADDAEAVPARVRGARARGPLHAAGRVARQASGDGGALMDRSADAATPPSVGIMIFMRSSCLIIASAVLVLAERKIMGFMQQRYGPYLVGPHGMLQPFADILKLLFKEELRPKGADKWLFTLAPVLSVTAAFAAFATVPFGAETTFFGLLDEPIKLGVADVNVGVLVVFAVTSMGVYGIVLAGWSSNSKYSLFGGLRASAQMISYELSYATALAAVILLAGSLSLREVVDAQAGYWFGFIPQLVHLPAAGRLHHLRDRRRRRDQPRAVRFPRSGAGARRRLQHRVQLGALRALPAGRIHQHGDDVGRGHRPVSRRLARPVPAGRVRAGSGSSLKVGVILFAYIWMRWTVPRYRYDQLMQFGWKWLFPASVINLIVTAALVLYFNA